MSLYKFTHRVKNFNTFTITSTDIDNGEVVLEEDYLYKNYYMSLDFVLKYGKKPRTSYYDYGALKYEKWTPTFILSNYDKFKIEDICSFLEKNIIDLCDVRKIGGNLISILEFFIKIENALWITKTINSVKLHMSTVKSWINQIGDNINNDDLRNHNFAIQYLNEKQLIEYVEKYNESINFRKYKVTSFPCQIIEKYEDLFDWSRTKYDKLSFDFIEKFSHRFDWGAITNDLIVCEKDMDFIRRFKHKIKWSILSGKVQIDNYKKIVYEFHDVFNFDSFLDKKVTQLDEWAFNNVIIKYHKKINMKRLFQKKTITNHYKWWIEHYPNCINRKNGLPKWVYYSVDLNKLPVYLVSKWSRLSLKKIQKYKDALDWKRLSKYSYHINILLERYPKYINFKYASKNTNISSKNLIKFKDKLNLLLRINSISINQKRLEKIIDHIPIIVPSTYDDCFENNYPREFLEKYYKKLDRSKIYYFTNIDDSFVENHEDMILNWGPINSKSRYRFSTDFIMKHFEKLNWRKLLVRRNDLPPTVLEHMLNHPKISSDRHMLRMISSSTTLTLEIIEKYKSKIDMVHLKIYDKITEKFIIDNFDHLDKGDIMTNCNVSEKFISSYPKLGWLSLSKVRYSEELQDKLLENLAIDVVEEESYKVQKYSKKIMQKHLSKFNLDHICKYIKWTENECIHIIDKRAPALYRRKYIELLMKHQNCSEKFVKKYRMYINNAILSEYHNLSDEFIIENYVHLPNLKLNKKIKLTYDLCRRIPITMRLTDSLLSKYTLKLADVQFKFV